MSKKSLKDSLQLNKPRRTPDHKTKSHVVKVNDGGSEKLIRFGQQGVTTAGKPKANESQTQKNRRKSFKARHAKNIAKGKTSAAYWANKVKWNEGGRVLGVTGDDPLTEAMTGTLGQFRTTQDRNPRTVTQETDRLADLNEDGRIDFYDGYEAVRPSYPNEIIGALKQAGSNISQGDIAKGAAMVGLGGLMLGDYFGPAKLVTGTIGRPIKSFLQDVAGNLPDTSVLEAASYKGRARDVIRGLDQGRMTAEQATAALKGKGISKAEQEFIGPAIEFERYQEKLKEMAGLKADATLTKEYLLKVLDNTEPGKSYMTRSGTTERYPTVLQEKEFGAGEAPWVEQQRRPAGLFGNEDGLVSDEYKEIVVTLTPEMKVQYQKDMHKAGLDIVDIPNPHYEDYPNAVFHMRTDIIRDELPDGKYREVTLSEEFQNDTAIKAAQEGTYDQYTKIDLNSGKMQLRKRDILDVMIGNAATRRRSNRGRIVPEDNYVTSGLNSISTNDNIIRAFNDLPDGNISRAERTKLLERIDEDIIETKEKIDNALYLDPPTREVPFESTQGTVYETAKRKQDDPQLIEELRMDLERLDAQRRFLNIATPRGVPKNFPFLKEWPQLAMQRLVNEGVGNGSDAIGWVNGAMSANSRGANKIIESFEYKPQEGKFKYFDAGKGKEIEVQLPSTKPYSGELSHPEFIKREFGEEISDIIFKDNPTGGVEDFGYAFDKPIIHDEIDFNTGKNKALGPKTLYDDVMVQQAKKLGKKYGVKPYKAPNGSWRMDITPEMREDFMLDVTYAEGGAVELDLGMDERDYQRAVTKETSSIADLNDDGVVNYVDLVEALRPTAPQELQEMGQTIIKLLSDDEIAKATTMAAMMGVSLVGFGRAATAGPRRDMTRSVMKEYDPNIVENRAEDIVKGVEGRGGRGPELKSGQDEVDYSKLRKEELDPVGYQATKMDKPIEEVDIEEKQIVELAPRKKINIEDLEGKMVLPFYGDRTSTGKRITRVDDIEFEQPVDTEGGRDFMLSQASQSDDKAIWASEQAIIRRLNQRAKQVTDETGKDVLAITGTMSPNAIDFNTMGPEALAEMVAVTITRGGIKKKDIKEFNAMMKSQITKDSDLGPVKDWPGLDAPNLREYLVEAPTKVRKKFMRLMEKKDPQAMGLPSPGKARLAVTDKEQLMLGPGMFGGSIGKIDVDADIITDPKVPHKTYSTQLRGEYVGEIDPVPQSELFTDLYEARKDVKVGGRPENEAHKTYTMKTQLPAQEITPEIVDRNMTAAERKKRGYQEGGAVEVSILDKVFDTILGAQATGGLEIQGRRDTVPMQFWDGEKITVEEVTKDQIGGYAELGLIKQINDNLIIDGSASVGGGAGRMMDNPFEGAIQTGPIKGGLTFTDEDLDVRLGGRYNPTSEEKFIGLEGKIRFAEGGVYNAKKIDMMSDQILESYDV